MSWKTNLQHWKTNTVVISFMAFLSAGCATAVHNPALEHARSAYERARRDPEVVGRAGVALEQARLTLEKAERAWVNDKDIVETEHLVYLTVKRAEIARVTARRRIAADEIQKLQNQRD
jgi:hypothetical protein